MVSWMGLGVANRHPAWEPREDKEIHLAPGETVPSE